MSKISYDNIYISRYDFKKMSEEVKSKDKELELGTVVFKKNNWRFFLLILVLLFAFYLRYYHIDYPVVGYHNWKETHYLTESRNFARDGFFERGFFVPSFDYLDFRGLRDVLSHTSV